MSLKEFLTIKKISVPVIFFILISVNLAAQKNLNYLG
jgi:hypothetical protein